MRLSAPTTARLEKLARQLLAAAWAAQRNTSVEISGLPDDVDAGELATLIRSASALAKAMGLLLMATQRPPQGFLADDERVHAQALGQTLQTYMEAWTKAAASGAIAPDQRDEVRDRLRFACVRALAGHDDPEDVMSAKSLQDTILSLTGGMHPPLAVSGTFTAFGSSLHTMAVLRGAGPDQAISLLTKMTQELENELRERLTERVPS